MRVALGNRVCGVRNGGSGAADVAGDHHTIVPLDHLDWLHIIWYLDTGDEGTRPVVESLLASQRATRDDEPPVYDTVERITGVPATAYRDWVADHLREFA
jgi:hypothetical protein